MVRKMTSLPAQRLGLPYLNLPGEASWPVIAASDIIT
jgi:hypothetical protein